MMSAPQRTLKRAVFGCVECSLGAVRSQESPSFLKEIRHATNDYGADNYSTCVAKSIAFRMFG